VLEVKLVYFYLVCYNFENQNSLVSSMNYTTITNISLFVLNRKNIEEEEDEYM